MLSAGLVRTSCFVRGLLTYEEHISATGLDITAAMLWAFGLAMVFADPPLF